MLTQTQLIYRKSVLKTICTTRSKRILSVNVYKKSPRQPTLFFIHGLGGRADQWREQIKLLKDCYTLIIPHLLGHGSSEKPIPMFSNPYSFDELDQDILSIFSQYKSGKNFVFGHSYGGVLATSLAKHYPFEINKLVLFNPIPCHPRHKSSIYKLPSFLLEILKPSLNQSFLERAFNKHSSPSLINRESEANMHNKMYVIKGMIRGMKTIKDIELSNVDVKTLIIMGETDGILPQKLIRDCYHHLPHHHFEMIPNTAHLTMLENPGKVNQLLTTFLEKEDLDQCQE